MKKKRDVKKRKDDVDFRWGEALDALQQFQDAREVLAMLADGAAVPKWVRSELAAWLAGKRPPLPPLLDGDAELLAAMRAYKETPFLPEESQAAKITRVLVDHPGVSALAVKNFLNGEGSAYRRLVTDWKRWERIYTPDEN